MNIENQTIPAPILADPTDLEKVYKLLKQVWYQWAAVVSDEEDESQYKRNVDFARFKRENGIDHL
jgi:hypothetical protein